MYRKSLDLVITIIVMIASIVTLFIDPNVGLIRIVAALSLIFVVPGYALTAAAFSERTLRFEELLLYTLALSIASTVLCGLALHYTSGGLQLRAWLTALGSTTVIASFVAYLRRSKDSPILTINARALFSSANLRIQLSLVLTIVITILAVVIARTGAVQEVTPGFTQFWILPVDQPNQRSLRLGVKNEETSPTDYRATVNAGNTLLGEWSNISLQPGEQWETQVSLASLSTVNVNITASLYRLDDPTNTYRRVDFWLGQ